MEICNKSGRAVNGDFHLKAQLNGKHITAKNQTMRIDTGRVMVETMYDLSENFQKWDEFSPAVYQLDASLAAEGNASNLPYYIWSSGLDRRKQSVACEWSPDIPSRHPGKRHLPNNRPPSHR
jgi:hypothetical protein